MFGSGDGQLTITEFEQMFKDPDMQVTAKLNEPPKKKRRGKLGKPQRWLFATSLKGSFFLKKKWARNDERVCVEF